MSEARKCQVEKRKINELNKLIDAKEVTYKQQLKLIRTQQSLIDDLQSKLKAVEDKVETKIIRP